MESSLQITRYANPEIDPKQALRAHVDQLSVEQQREFIAAAYQLLGDRIDLSKVGKVLKKELLS
jgi:hypothetical protein